MTNLKDKLDELAKNSDFIVSSPDAIERLKAQGIPIKSTFITYKEYLDKLFEEKRKVAEKLIEDLPRLDERIANATIQSLYDEIKETFILGIPGAGITLSLILLELSLKYRLFNKRLEDDPNSKWDYIEQIDFTKTVNALRNKEIISPKEKKELEKFNLEVRNPYIHYNIKKLIKGMKITKLPSINIETEEVTIHHNVKPESNTYLWFSAKRFLDKKLIKSYAGYCIGWANKLLSTNQDN